MGSGAVENYFFFKVKKDGDNKGGRGFWEEKLFYQAHRRVAVASCKRKLKQKIQIPIIFISNHGMSYLEYAREDERVVN